MPALNFQLFGKFSGCCAGLALAGLDANKVQELLCYLLIHRQRPHARETLAALLWGDSSTEKSKKYLRQALWHLQAALDAHAEASGGQMLSVEHDWVRLNCERAFTSDVAVFEQAYAAAQACAGRELDEEKSGALAEAVALYKGDLLEGWYQDWCLYERERLQNMYLSMLAKLMSYCEARGEYERGQVYGALVLRHDRASERTHRQLMNMQYKAGDRTAALRQYERCCAALDEELGVKPDQRTTALYEQIRSDNPRPQTPPAHPAPVSDHTAAPAPVSLPEVLGRLRRLQRVLTEVQRQVQQDIKAVELTLTGK